MKSSLVVTTAATSTDLTVLATVKEELGIAPQDNSNDAVLQKAIRRASGIVTEYCGQKFAQETVTETFWPEYSRGGCAVQMTSLLLTRRPIVSIASVTVDGSEKSSSEYRFNSASGELAAISSSGYPSFWGIAQGAVVVYTAGYALLDSLPDGIEDAVLILIRDAWFAKGRDPRVRSESIPGVISYDYWVGQIGQSGMPPDVVSRLEIHRPPVVV
jgi:hypothetical protein